MNFITEFHQLWNAIERVDGRTFNGPDEPPEDFLARLYDLRVPIQVYGSAEAHALTQKTFDTMFEFAFKGQAMPTEPLADLLAHIRADLAIPEQPKQPQDL